MGVGDKINPIVPHIGFTLELVTFGNVDFIAFAQGQPRVGLINKRSFRNEAIIFFVDSCQVDEAVEEFQQLFKSYGIFE